MATANVAALERHERERVAGLDDEPALRRQREPELGEHREVARADAPEVAQRGQRGLAQERRERVGHLRPAPAGAGRHLREPHQQRGAHHLVRQRVAQPARVAAQEPHRVGAQVAVHGDVAVGAHAGRAAVDLAPRGDRHGGGVAGGHALAGRGREDRGQRPAARRGGHGGGREGLVSDAQGRHARATQPHGLDGSARPLVFRPVEGEGRT